jgi:small subunit ribosomal protein S16
MVTIRLFRTGKANQPYYRIVAVDQRRKRQGRVLENLGTYDPRGGGGVQLRRAAVESWIAKGARPSDTVRSLIRRHRQAAAAVDAPQA